MGVRPPRTPFGPTVDDHLTRVRRDVAQRGRQVIRHQVLRGSGNWLGAASHLAARRPGGFLERGVRRAE
ncbi:hypothetical protein GCM10018775_58730 [Streptomyces umbrinus]|nr:hypothetical protein GCM10018775_58730 [Streptomyces umbrinus]